MSRIAGDVAVFDSYSAYVPGAHTVDGPSILHHNILCVCKNAVQEVPCCMQPGHGALTVRTSMLEQLVYTYIAGRIAGEVAVFDSQSPLAEDGPS